MSRVGKLPIEIPAGVQVAVNDKNLVTVKGKLGELSQQVDPCITLKIESSTVTLERHTEQKRHRAMHGLYRALVANMIHGVSDGYKVVQELVGVGYKASATGQLLELALGYSHNIFVDLPVEIKVETRYRTW